MPQDAFTLNFLCAELQNLLVGGKVNKIVQPDNDEVIFTIYAKSKTQKLIISVNPSMPRIGITQEEKQSPITALNFCMLLRKHLLGSTIEDVCLVGFDRIVKITFTPSNEYFDEPQKVLYVELMGRYSNIILTEKEKILGGNRGINVFDNGVRPLFVGKKYTLPPVGEKKEPLDKSLVKYISNIKGDLAEGLFAGVQGIALSTAKEIVDSYIENGGEFNDGFENSFHAHLVNFIYSNHYSPCVYTQNGMVTDVSVFPYKNIDGEIKNYPTLCLAEDYYYKQVLQAKAYKNAKERVNALLQSATKKVKKKLSLLRAREKDAEDCEKNRIYGELILANIYALKQGQKECELLNYYDGTTVKINLDEGLTPSKNAERYYKKYNKQKRTLSALQPQIEEAKSELEYLQTIGEEIALADTLIDVKHILFELEQTGYGKNKQTKPSKKPKEVTYRQYLVDGYSVLVGRNNVENDKLTFSARSNDVWVHVKDYHSSHVVISAKDGKEIPENVILVAGQISAYYSKARNGGKAEIVYTKRKNVKKPPKSKPGFCVYENFKSMVVTPNKCEEFLKTE